MDIRIENAIIKYTHFGWEDHGILTVILGLEGDGWGQGFGCCALDEPIHQNGEFKGRIGTAKGLQFLTEIMRTVGVERWEDLPGKMVRVKHGGVGSSHAVLGHAMKNKWLDPREFFKT